MKKTIVSTICACFLMTAPAVADDSHSHGTTAAAPAKTEKKTARKKRQLMCRECGKPEKNCECEGEGHRKEEGHAPEHGESQAHDKKEEKKK